MKQHAGKYTTVQEPGGVSRSGPVWRSEFRVSNFRQGHDMDGGMGLGSSIDPRALTAVTARMHVHGYLLRYRTQYVHTYDRIPAIPKF